jgi:hypothetical protein
MISLLSRRIHVAAAGEVEDHRAHAAERQPVEPVDLAAWEVPQTSYPPAAGRRRRAGALETDADDVARPDPEKG